MNNQKPRLIHDGEFHRIYRIKAEEEKGDASSLKAVAIKASKPGHGGDVSDMNNEYNILTQRLADCPGVRGALRKGMFDANDGTGPLFALHLEWVEGFTLEKWLADLGRQGDGDDNMNDLSCESSLLLSQIRVAHGLVIALASIHEAGVVHSDFVADNVIVKDERNNCSVTIIGFNFAEYSRGVMSDEGELYNDDIYALALLLKDIFKQQKSKPAESPKKEAIFGLSFGKAVSMEENLEDDDEFAPDLPRSVRRLLADLMDYGHGTRVTRYDSVSAVASDLAQMLSDPFVFISDPNPVEKRKSTFQRPPTRLYGREEEMATLTAACNRLVIPDRKETAEVVLIAGHSGTGKSALCKQAQKAASSEEFFFVIGKFDQLQNTRPYSALILAFSELCEIILAKEQDAVARIREDILAALGCNGKVLTDVIPKLIELIGEQPEVPHVKGIEAHNRFKYVFRTFVAAVAGPVTPLVVVLDDLQWADAASTDLMQALMVDGSNRHLLFIGCYRDDEMPDDHFFSVQLHEMRNVGFPITKIDLQNMDEDTMHSYVSERLRLTRRLTKPLGEIVHRKTLGNPFFVTQFLSSLADDGLLVFCPKLLRWKWDEAGAEAKSISDDVVELMADKIQSLPPGLQTLLKVASCIGSIFDTDMLLDLSTVPAPEEVGLRTNAQTLTCNEKNTILAKAMQELIKQGLVSQLHSKLTYKFSHDRIQQASYSLLSETERDQLHVRIGRIFQTQLSTNDATSLIFKATDQLNIGLSGITDKDDQYELAKLNARAGEEAYASCAFAPSAKYIEKGLKLLGDDERANWKDHYSLTLQFYNVLAEVKYCIGDFVGSKRVTDLVLHNAKDFDDCFNVYTCLIRSLMYQGKLDDALANVLEVLRALGEPLPKKVTNATIALELIKTKRLIRNKKDDFFLSLPKNTNSRIMKVNTIMSIACSAAFLSNSLYFPVFAFRFVRLSIRYGVDDVCSFGYSVFGFIAVNRKDTKEAYRWGQLGLSVLGTVDAKHMLPKSHAIVYGSIFHHRNPIHSTIEPLLNVYQVGLEVGDIEYACYGILIHSIHALYSGQNIGKLLKQQRVSLQNVAKGKHHAPADLIMPFHQATLNLWGESADPVRLNGEAMNEDQMLKRSAETKNQLLFYYVHMNAAFVAYIFCEFDLAAEHSRKIEDIGEKFPSIYAVNVQAFFDGLSSFALARKYKKKRWNKRGKKITRQFEEWAKDCHVNNIHKVLLLKAESASLKGKESSAKREYTKTAYASAISAARDNGFVNDEAIANERAALFYEEIGERELSAKHMTLAHKLYLKWGAKAKAERIASEHLNLKTGGDRSKK